MAVNESGYFLVKRVNGKVDFYPAVFRTSPNMYGYRFYEAISPSKNITLNKGDILTLITCWEQNEEKELQIVAGRKYTIAKPEIKNTPNNKSDGEWVYHIEFPKVPKLQ